MTKGIYQYKDLVKNIVVYIGKDSHIDENRRNYYHNLPSCYDSQKINQVIQNNHSRYEYSKICEYDDLTDDELNYLEVKEIMKHKFLYGKIPKFNFTIGGEGKIGYRKPYEDFKYTVVKGGFHRGKQAYAIFDRNAKPIKRSIDKDFLDEIAEKLNNGLLTEEEVKAWKYTIAKSGFNNGNQQYCIYDKHNYPVKSSINKEALDELVEKLNNGLLTEKETKLINLNPFKYTVTKGGLVNGKQKYMIRDRDHNSIKISINKKGLDKIADALNNGSLIEEEVKKTHGVKKILDMLEN